MDYCTIEDIETHISTPTLIQLTNDDGEETVDREVATEAIVYSSAIIDGYLRGRYTLITTLFYSPKHSLIKELHYILNGLQNIQNVIRRIRR